MKQQPYHIPTWGITVKPSGIGDPFIDPDTDDTRREDEPGDWFIAGFDGECSRGGEKIIASDTIRADGDGGWECRECVTGQDLPGDRVQAAQLGAWAQAFDQILPSGGAA